jgi:hypothetical protein
LNRWLSRLLVVSPPALYIKGAGADCSSRPGFPVPERTEPGMKYLRSYQFLFDSPKWLTNLLAGTLAIIVPIVGPIVFIGYQFEIIEGMHLRGEEKYPDFDTNRLSQYLLRGLWPFLVQLIVGLPFGLLMAFLWIVVVIAGTTAGAGNKDGGGVFVLIVLCFFVLVIVVANLLLPLVMLPLSLRAGLTQDLGASFSMAFLKDFIGKMWVEMVLVQIFFLVTGPFVIIIGLLACLVGVYPAAALLGFAQAYLLYELYELYLQRGGSEIPLKAEPRAY